MIPKVSPNRVIGVAIALFVLYWILALFIPGKDLRGFFNAVAFGIQLFVVVTWGSAAAKAMRSDSKDGAWLLVLAVFHICLVALLSRTYSIVYNYFERPASWTDHPISGFFPYSFAIASVLLLISPDVQGSVMRPRAWWMLLSSVAVGMFIAGFLFATSLSF